MSYFTRSHHPQISSPSYGNNSGGEGVSVVVPRNSGGGASLAAGASVLAIGAACLLAKNKNAVTAFIETTTNPHHHPTNVEILKGEFEQRLSALESRISSLEEARIHTTAELSIMRRKNDALRESLVSLKCAATAAKITPTAAAAPPPPTPAYHPHTNTVAEEDAALLLGLPPTVNHLL